MVHLLLRIVPVLLLGAACTNAPVEHASLDPMVPPHVRGKSIYETSCNRCHALYMPTSFGADEWPFFVRKYGRKARLSAEERDLVTTYLQAHARR